MNKGIKYFFTVGFLACFFVVPAQVPKNDFIKINAFYHDHPKMSMLVGYSVFLDQNKVAYETETGMYKREGDNYYVKQMDCEIIRNKKFVAVVSNEEKVVMLDKTPKSQELNYINVNLDSVFKRYKSVRFYVPENAEGLKAYSFAFTNGQYETVDVIFDPANFAVRKLIIRYREPMEEDKVFHKVTMTISYSDIETNPKFSSSVFSESNFVRKTKDGFILQPKYKNYDFINHIKNEG